MKVLVNYCIREWNAIDRDKLELTLGSQVEQIQDDREVLNAQGYDMRQTLYKQ